MSYFSSPPKTKFIDYRILNSMKNERISSEEKIRTLQVSDTFIKVEQPRTKFQLINPEIKSQPTKGSIEAAGHDLRAGIIENIIIEAHKQMAIPTNIRVSIPRGYYGRLAPRSGLALKHMISVQAGVVDSDFRGEVLVILLNNSDEAFTVNSLDRIAQIIIEKCDIRKFEEIPFDQPLDETERNEDGFGSTGTK
jgi:dUTP pyrophosphatase